MVQSESESLLEIGQLLKANRKGRQLTQEQVADIAGISRPRYREIEAGSSAARTLKQRLSRTAPSGEGKPRTVGGPVRKRLLVVHTDRYLVVTRAVRMNKPDAPLAPTPWSCGTQSGRRSTAGRRGQRRPQRQPGR